MVFYNHGPANVLQRQARRTEKTVFTDFVLISRRGLSVLTVLKCFYTEG
jgi:hypothetical protein